MKRYISHSIISIPISVGTCRRRIQFNPLSTGGSEHLCVDKEVCMALEQHPDFGTLYRLDPAYSVEASTAPVAESEAISEKVDDTPDTESDIPEENSEAPASGAIIAAEVTSLNEAKAYLQGQGVATTMLRTKAMVLSAAKERKIEFPNLG